MHWTSEQDTLLIRNVSEHGKQWEYICQFFDGLSARQLKNRFYYLRTTNRISPVFEDTKQIS